MLRRVALNKILEKTQCGMEMMKAKTLGTVTLCSAILIGTSLLGQTLAPAAPAAPQTTDNDGTARKDHAWDEMRGDVTHEEYVDSESR